MGTAEQSGVSQVVLRIADISKSFGNLRANDRISFDLKEGEVLALLGENGAGKTTLMNILFGHYVADAGLVEAFGKPLKAGSPRAAINAGIGMVHQHFALADNLSVVENVVVGTDSLWSPYLDRAAARARLEAVAAQSGLTVDPRSRVGDLTVGERQRVEILKALYRGARVLILDEPTAVLTPQEIDQLFQTIRDLVAGGMSVIFISHKLKEVLRISDRVIVLRSGRVVFEAPTAGTNATELAQQMVGRELPALRSELVVPGPAVLRFSHVSVRSKLGQRQLDDVDLIVHRNQIVGVVGVSGNGQNVLFNVVAGLTAPQSGEVRLGETTINGLSPIAIVGSGVGRIPEDRHAEGLIVDMLIWENAISESYRSSEFQKAGVIRGGNARNFASGLIREFDIRCPSPNVPTRVLSGGNLQKLVIGRILSREPQLIIANQPTRGLDVGAVSFVHEKLIKAKERGAGVLLISEDLDELLALSDTLVVMYDGALSEPIPRDRASVQTLGLMMMGQGWDTAHAV